MLNFNPEQVTNAIREVGQNIILPRWRNLQQHEISEKTGPHDLVTIADKEAERDLTPMLQNILPGSVVLGEEGVAADPGILGILQGKDPVWIIDPIDGTGHFAKGEEDFGTIIALVRHNEILAGWIHHHVTGDTLIAEHGAGAYFRGEKLRVLAASALPEMHGALGGRLHDPVERYPGAGEGPKFDRRKSFVSCHIYVAMLTGQKIFPGDRSPPQQHFRVTMMGSKPWDDAAGVLALRESGGEVIDWTRERYRPDMYNTGIIAAPGYDACLKLCDWLTPAYRAAMEAAA